MPVLGSWEKKETGYMSNNLLGVWYGKDTSQLIY